MTLAAGIDLGAAMVKVALVRVADGQETLQCAIAERIRRRDPFAVAAEVYAAALRDAGSGRDQVDYVATTGEADALSFATGHFFGMTTHARGGLFLVPQARGVLDVGALHGRAVRMDGRGKVLAYKMTSQCASGSGQFLENIARYLGVALQDVGTLSCGASRPEKISGICAVLAETDVINMVSRGIPTPDILRGIHESMAGRLTRLLVSAGAAGKIVVTGGLSRDIGMIKALVDDARAGSFPFEIVTHQDAIHAGAIGAALWGAFRHDKLTGAGRAEPTARLPGNTEIQV